MGRLIDADRLKEYIDAQKGRPFIGCTIGEALKIITDEQPTVDAVPVRHGRWIKKRYWSDWYGMGESYGYWYKCSECGGEVKGGYESCDNKFCRNCGADMRKDGDGND